MNKQFKLYNQAYVCITYGILALTFLIILFVMKGSYLNSIEKLQDSSVLNDFFSGIKASNGITVASFGVTPFSLLVFNVVSVLIPHKLLSEPITKLKFIQQGNFVCISFICILFLIFASLLLVQNRGYRLHILLCSLVSIPYIYVFHSGGLELLTLIFCTCFLQYVDSPSLNKRVIAYFSLGIACSLNFCLIFLILMIHNKKPALIVLITIMLISIFSMAYVNGINVFQTYLFLFFENIKIWPNILLIFLIVMIHFKFSTLINPIEELFLLCFLTGYLFGENFNNIFTYFIFCFLSLEKFDIKTKKELFVLFLCEHITFFVISPLSIGLKIRSALCLVGCCLLLASIIYEIIKKVIKGNEKIYS